MLGLISVFVIPIALSVHYLVGWSRSLSHKKDPSIHFYGRSYRHYTLEKACAYYKSLDNSIIFQFTDVNLAWSALHHIILNCANKFCPKRKISTRPNQPPWITKEILKLLADHDLLFQEALLNHKHHLLPLTRKREPLLRELCAMLARPSYK